MVDRTFAQPCNRGLRLNFADLCSARLLLGRRAIELGEISNNDADDDAGEEAMPDDMDCAAAPKMNTSLVAVSGIVGAVGGAKENAERNCASG